MRDEGRDEGKEGETMRFEYINKNYGLNINKHSEEAMRLAEKEHCRFIVLKVIGFADKKPQPIEWQDF